ncbi:MAG TPA: PQQ-binding-like beta-propeller repeat protein [Mycobacteriales bacterium]|nr:PQQ-binding-like beta-propeller repeat protein [Mycobacteriales bacterium]
MSRSRKPGRTAAARAARLLGLATLAASTSAAVSASDAVGAAPSYHFDRPAAIAAAGGRLWIANRDGNSVTMAGAGGAPLGVLAAAKYRFGRPDAIAAAGGRVWVLSRAGRVTELRASNGALVRVVRGSRYRLHDPVAITVAGADVVVASRSSNTVTVIDAATGDLVRVVSNHTASGLRLDHPIALAVHAGTVWVANQGGSVSAFRLATGTFVRRVAAKADGFATPAGIAYAGGRIWVSDQASNAVTELRTDGKLVQVITNSSNNANYGFDGPTVVAGHGKQVFVVSPPGSSPMVTKVETKTADGDWYECNTNKPNPHFANPTGLAFLGTHIWVVSPANNSLAELHYSTGALIKRFV